MVIPKRLKGRQDEKSFRNTIKLPEGWKEVCLKEITDIMLSGVDKRFHIGQKSVLLCNYTDVYNNNYITNSIDFTEATATDSEIANFALRIGDVLITKDSETPNDIGVPSVVVENLYNVLCGYHLALLRPKNNSIVSIYIAKTISHENVRRQFARMANGITRFGLTKSAIENIRILLPPRSEQRKIGEILVLWDKAIEKITTLIDSKVKLKKALMQQLLTGKLRFKEFEGQKWKMYKLNHFFKEFTERNLSNEHLTILSCTKTGGIVSQAERFGKRLASKSLIRYKIVRKGDLIYDPMLLWDASIGFLKRYDIGVISPAYFTFHFDESRGDRNFFENFFYSHYMRQMYKIISQGTNVRRRKAPKEAFLNIEIKLPPSLEEQQKIAAVLNRIDKEIELLKKQLECLKTQKKGIMQKLLTGEIRVKI